MLHYWRISNEWLVKYPPFWLPVDIKKLLTSDLVITYQKFRSSGRHVTQISTWQRRLLARLAAEKQEVSCKTLLKLENNSLKGVWSTIQILKNYCTDIMPGQEENLESQEKRQSRENVTSSLLTQRATTRSLMCHYYYYNRLSTVSKSYKVFKKVEVLHVFLQWTLRIKTALQKSLANDWTMS